MRMCIQARTIRLTDAKVYTHTRIVIRLYYIDREIANACENRASESDRM